MKQAGVECNDIPLIQVIAWQFQEFGYSFVPLVRKSMDVSCSLDILIMRKDPLETVISSGDLDNRVKTLIDAMTKPGNQVELGENQNPLPDEYPFFCLLEDDRLVTRLVVETDKWLSPTNIKTDGDRSEVKVVISVEIKPYHTTMANIAFA